MTFGWIKKYKYHEVKIKEIKEYYNMVIKSIDKFELDVDDVLEIVETETKYHKEQLERYNWYYKINSFFG